jgi:hypothetical protein
VQRLPVQRRLEPLGGGEPAALGEHVLRDVAPVHVEASASLAGIAPGPAAPAPPTERRAASDGCEYALCGRTVDVDRASRRVTRAIQAWQWCDGELVAEEEHVLTESLYERDELVELLDRTGFVEVEVRSGACSWDHEMSAFLGRRPMV